jgi:hypothetical protein
MALAEAQLPVDPALVKRGEYRSASGEQLTYQLLDAASPPTAIFAANNSIAIGVLQAIEKRGLRVPHDVALVCFDDLPDTSRFFPFLTVVVQPAYEMGVHAAQLLLSRLDAEVMLQPSHVVLPARLIIRRSCGNKLKEMGDGIFSLPLPDDVQSQSFLVKQITFEEMQHAATCLKGLVFSIPREEVPQPNYDKSDVNRM